jgi:glycosyltransferase involved in cell wall biosynthesis
MPTYNCGQYIKKAIDSVLKQPYNDKELIVIDGGSKDDTVEILKSYGDKIEWVSEKDNGQADAINKGFKKAKGEIVTWLNADDYYEPDIFEYVVKEFEKDPQVVLVYGNCKSVSKLNTSVNIPPKNITSRDMIQKGNFIFQPASFYRMETIKKINYLNDKLNFWMEYEMFIQLLKNGKGFYVDKFLANFTLREDQKSNFKNIIEMDKELYSISRKHGGNHFSKIFFKKVFNQAVNLFRQRNEKTL